MATTSTKFIPELWSKEILKAFTVNINMRHEAKRPYGERLLRAAAKGEDWTKIKRVEETPDDAKNDWVDVAAYAMAQRIDADILDSISNK